MNYNIKLDLTHLLGPKYKKYNVILTDHHPVITWNKPKYKRPVITNLWYPIKMEHQTPMFSDYLREKLGVTNPAEAKQIINDLKNQPLIIPSIKKEFTIGQIHFTVLKIPALKELLAVLGTHTDRPKHYYSVGIGGGGYVWQTLPKDKLFNDSVTQADLRIRFGLRLKSDRDSFIKKWNK